MTQATQTGTNFQTSTYILPSHSLIVSHAVALAGAIGIAMPLAVVLLRVPRFGFKPHWILQSLALGACVVGLAIAIYMSAESTAFRHFNEGHQIIGIVVVVIIITQALLGLAHHVNFKRLKRRSVVSYFHLWTGRSVIAIGMLNTVL
jgi:hypothetical protein